MPNPNPPPPSQPALTQGNAKVTPVATANELTYFWYPDLPQSTCLFQVEVLGRNGDVLQFKLIGAKVQALPPNHPARQPVQVNLDNTQHVWPALPSTAQLVTSGGADRYGFLLLSQLWSDTFAGGVPIHSIADTGPGDKWPKGAGE